MHTRRQFLGGAAAAAAAISTLTDEQIAQAKQETNLAAVPPAGFTPFAAPGKVVKVSKKGSLQENQKYPKADDAKEMLTRALMELTGKADLVASVGQFVHKDDVVCVKVNGIAGTGMGTNKELVLPFLQAMIDLGVKPENITVLEQYGGFLAGTRVSQDNVPKGVKIVVHQNAKDNPAMAPMEGRLIPGTGTQTKFVKPILDATCVINFALVKDHSICGYTGALKNMSHGCSINPHDFHGHHASPQIALMYAQDVIRSRVRLVIKDGYKVMADGGPKITRNEMVKPHEAVYVSTDPVAIDQIGWEVVEEYRKNLNLKTLTEVGRPPAYIKAAADLGLGIAERSKITFKEVTI